MERKTKKNVFLRSFLLFFTVTFFSSHTSYHRKPEERKKKYGRRI
jgi:hypothetical protein